MEQKKKYKYTTIGVYKRPKQEDMDFYKEKGWGEAPCQIQVYLGKQMDNVTLNNSDTLVFTKAAQKLEQAEVNKDKWSEAQYNYIVKTFSDPLAIAEVNIKKVIE